MRAAVARGEECRETLLNYRGEQRVPWWNEIYLAPVVDAEGRVVQYIGVQNDVTARVEAQRALVHERDRAQTYLTRIEQLAYTDPLTGLMNRGGWRARSRPHCSTPISPIAGSRCCSSTSTASSR